MTNPSPILIALLIALVVTISAASADRGRFVGGKTVVRNVRSNKEVQELGRYCVEQYNRSAHLVPGGNGAVPLMFVEVVEAEKQVVAGIKYFLKVDTIHGGSRRVFDAQVVVQPWLQSRKMLSFAPSAKLL